MFNKSNAIAQMLSALFIVLSVLPGYYLYGNLILQVLITVVCTFLCLLIFDFFKTKAIIISRSLIIMTVFWTTVALIKQIILHINVGDYSLRWLHLFYYDRPALLFVIMFTTLAFYIIKLIKNNNETFLKDYSSFLKSTISCMTVYYIIILIYCFILVRNITFVRPVPNLIPFYMIRETFAQETLDYKMFFLFLGNIAIFLPLGVCLSALSCKKTLLVIFPLFLSIGIEISQYLLGNGHPDVDDVILNILGFYLGIIIKRLVDLFIYKATRGKIKSIFIFN